MTTRKRDGTPLPDVIYPPDTMQVTLCIPKNRSYLSSFFGALWQLTFWNYWENNGTDDGKKVAAVWYDHWMAWDREMNNLECEDGMSTCCIEPTTEKRINPTTGRPEIRYNGGDWQPDPSDPQGGVLVQPPIVGEGMPSQKCDAASNAHQHFVDIVNAMSSNIASASSLYTLAIAITTVLLEVFIIVVTGGLASPIAITIVGMIWGAGSAAFTAGQAAFDDYWDSDALDKVLCALFCNIGDNGQFTEDQYQAFLTDVRSELDSSPARDFVLTAITAGGAAGLSNMASYGGSADSDCSECECEEMLCPTEWTAQTGSISYDSENGHWIMTSAPVGGGQHICDMVTSDMNQCCQFGEYQVVSGAVNFTYHIDCGLEQVGGNIGNFWSNGECYNYLSAQGGEPFVVNVVLLPCEE